MKAEVIAPDVLIDYAWEIIRMNTDLTTADYDGLIPIVPLAEEPELKEFAKPYIVYGYAESPTAQGIWRNGSLAFVIYSERFRTLQTITNLLTVAFENADESARRVNEFIAGGFDVLNGQPVAAKTGFVGLKFGFIDLAYVEGGSPEDTEGGRQSAVVNIRYAYTADYDVNVKAVPSTWP